MTEARAQSPPAPGGTTPAHTGFWAGAKRIVRPLLFALGVGAVVLLVRGAGPEAVLQTILHAGVWLPLIAGLEIVWISMDVVALRGLAGPSRNSVSRSDWIRSGLLAYGIMILLPAGRAGGEVARAAALAPRLGGARAAAMATRLQAATLLANAFISVPCWIAVALASNVLEPLAWLVLGNGLATAVVGGAILLAAKKSKVGGWLGGKIAALGSSGASFDEALREETPAWPAVLACSFGRLLQTLQYGVLLLAVGGVLTVNSALVSQGIHLVGAGLGDMVPNQVGITEGAYQLFAAPLGLADAPARAIGIALIARICQFSLAGASLLIGAVWKPRPIPLEGSGSQ